MARRIKQLLLGSATQEPADWGLEPISGEDLEFVRERYPRKKFFIMGHARSGTTLLGRLARLHPEVHCDWQLQFFSERGMIPRMCEPTMQSWLNHPSNHWTEGADPTTVLLRIICDHLLERDAEKLGKRIVGDKSVNGNGREAVDWLAAIYPDARLLYIVRDGRDTVLSKRVQLFIDQPEFLGRDDRRILTDLMAEPDRFLAEGRSFFTESWLEQAATKWAQDVQGSVDSGRRHFGDAFYCIRFEDLLQQPVESMQAIWHFLGATDGEEELDTAILEELDLNPSAQWHESLGIDFINELPRGVHGAWKEVFTSQDELVFSRAAGDILAEWAY